MSYKYFLVCGTMQELHHIARERYINPRSIKLVHRVSDIFGHRGGKLIIGYTGSYNDFDEIVNYARTHDIEVP